MSLTTLVAPAPLRRLRAFAQTAALARTPRRRGAALLMIAVLCAQLAPLASPAGASADPLVVTPGTGTTAWSVTTTPVSTNTVPHDGTGGVAEFTYNYLQPGYVPGSNNGNGNGSGVPTQTWRFSSTATIAGQITLPWRLHGLHAWAGVTVDLRAYIKRGASDVQNTDLLLPGQQGPVSCCTTPSNGFDYSGTTNLTIQVGDEFGFIVSGGNGDSNSFLQGDLQVGLQGVVNGSFEDPVVALSGPQAYQYPGPNPPLTGWTVPSGSVDLTQPDVWNAADGNQTIDLDGFAAGSLRQTLATVPGQQYQVTFKYSSNPGDGNVAPSTLSASMDVKAGSTTIGSFTHAYGPKPVPAFSPAVLSFDSGQATFTATAATTQLDFVSTDAPSSAFGIVLDDVVVTPALSSSDFAFGVGPGVSLSPSGSGQSVIPTSGGSGGTIALTTSILPLNQGVTADAGATVVAGSPATLHVTASADAVPGVYTATVSGTLGGFTHSVTVPIVVTQAVGIPGLVLAVPADLGATDGTFIGSASGANALFLTGMVNGPPSTTYALTLLTSDSCSNGSLGAGPTVVQTLDVSTSAPVTLHADITAAGTAYFGGALRVAPGSLHNFVAARIGTGAIGQCIVVSSANDQWPYAADISSTTASGAPVSGFVDTAGRARWYKFTVQPGAKVDVHLTGLSSDDDVFIFKDVSAAYAGLTSDTATLTKLSAEFAAADVANAFTSNAFTSNAFTSNAFTSNAFTSNAFTSNAFTSNAFTSNAFTSNAFTSNAFTSNAFTSNAFTSNAFTSNAFTSNAFTSNAFTSNAFTSNAFTSNAFTSNGQFNPYGVNPDAYSSAQVRSVIAGSANTGTVDETLTADTWTNTGTFYVRVNGKGSAASDQPFSLSVQLLGNTCAGIDPIPGAPLTDVQTNVKSLVLWDSSRYPELQADDVATLGTTLDTFKARPEIGGAVVDVSDSAFAWSTRLHDLNAQADAHPDCVYAKNLVAYAFKDIVQAYRAVNPTMQYVVLVGGDSEIPFFRYPDENQLGPEKDFDPPVDSGSASDASLKSNYILGQDEYGSTTSLSLGTYSFPIPDLAVGRLVETAADANTVLHAYLDTAAGVVEPNNGVGAATDYSSLVTGYDFLADAATTVKDELADGTTASPSTLIDLPTQGGDTWSGSELTHALTQSRHDLMFLAGHFSATRALASDFTTDTTTTDLVDGLAATGVDLTNSIVFSAGCHSGYNLVDADQTTGDPLDWAQALAGQGATLIAGTGYQYGDSDLELWSERVYGEFAHQLRVGTGPVAIGSALIRSKQVYLASTPDVLPMDAKALLQSALFGLPMLSVDLPAAGRVSDASGGSAIGSTALVGPGPGHELGLQTAPLTTSTQVSSIHTKTLNNYGGGGTTDVSWVSGHDGIAASPGLPVLPLTSVNVSVPSTVLRGVGFRSGTFTDTPNLTPLTASPSTDFNFTGIQGFESPNFFPALPWRANYFDAFGAGNQTRLLLTPAQFKATGGPIGSTTLRSFTNLGLQLFYSDNNDPAFALASAPSIGNVVAFPTAGGITFQATTSENPAGIQGVWVTYTGTGTNAWQSIDLAQVPGANGVWTGTLPFTGSPSDFRYIVQGVNGVGLVGRADNAGAFYGVASGTGVQTITFNSITGKTYGDANFAVNPTASSGLAVTLSSDTPATCSLVAGQIHLVGAGTCTIAAGQPGDATHLAAPIERQSFTIAKKALTIRASDQVKIYGVTADLGTSAFTTSVNPLPNNDTIASVVLTSAGAVASATAGVYPITPSEAVAGPGTNLTNYQIAYADAPIGLTVGRAAGSISIANIPALGVVLSGFVPTYTQTGDGIASTTSSTPAVCTVSSGAVSFVGVGTCTLTAALAQGTNHLAAIGAAQSFTVVNPVPTVTSTVPASIGRGAISFPLSVVGTGFVSGAAVTISGTGVTVNSTTYVDPTHLTATVSVTTTASLTNRNVIVTNPGTAAGTCSGCLGINQGPYGIAAVPLSVGRGAVNETISVIGVNFVGGTWTPASIQFSGPGITVNSVTRQNSLLLSVNISIDAGAATGARSLTVVNPDGGRSTALAAFTVNAAPAITSLNPSSRGQGAANQVIVITGSNFGSGSWSNSSVSFSGTGITVNSVSRSDSTHLSVNVSVGAGAATGARDVTVRNTDDGRATKTGAFTVTAAPGVTSLSPGSRGQGATSQVIVVTGANFAAGSWPASAVAFSGSGITVNSVTRTDATHLSVNISTSSTAAVGARSITVSNPSDGGTASLANAFTVNARPTIAALNPSSRSRGQSNQNIVLTGTGFVAGATVSFSGSGITVVSVTFTDATHLTVKISVASGASTGNRNVTVTNPDQGTFTLTSGFKVT